MCLGLIISLSSLFSLVNVFAVDLFFRNSAHLAFISKNCVLIESFLRNLEPLKASTGRL